MKTSLLVFTMLEQNGSLKSAFAELLDITYYCETMLYLMRLKRGKISTGFSHFLESEPNEAKFSHSC